MERSQRIQRLRDHIENGTLIRGRWTGTDRDGRETACLLSALSPESGESGSASACPTDAMPKWLACLTPFMNDCGSESKWANMVQRYADLASRWHVLSANTWHRLDYMARRIALLEYRIRDNEVYDIVIGLFDREISGDVVSEDEWESAEKAAWAQAQAAEDSNNWEAVSPALALAQAVVRRVYWSADAAAERAAMRDLTGSRKLVADRITNQILDAIEEKILLAEKAA